MTEALHSADDPSVVHPSTEQVMPGILEHLGENTRAIGSLGSRMGVIESRLNGIESRLEGIPGVVDASFERGLHSFYQRFLMPFMRSLNVKDQ